MKKVDIGFCEALLAGDGDNLPVGLLHIDEDLRILLVITGFGELFGEGCHLVGIQDFTACEQRLFHRHRTQPQVMHVGMKGLVDIRANGVHRAGNIRHAQLHQV